MINKPASETTALWAFLLLLAAVAALTMLHGCSIVSTPYGYTVNFLYDSSTEVEVTLPDGTKVKVRRDINPNAAAIEGIARGATEGAVKGAIGGER